MDTPKTTSLDAFQIYNLPEMTETIKSGSWKDDDLTKLELDKSFLDLPWPLQVIKHDIVCRGMSNGHASVYIPDNTVIHLSNHRGQINMGWNERGVVDPTGRFIHNGDIHCREWPATRVYNKYCFLCAVDTTDGTQRQFLKNPSIPECGASLDGYWSFGTGEGGRLRIWFNDDYRRDNSGQFHQELTMEPTSAFLKRYKTLMQKS